MTSSGSPADDESGHIPKYRNRTELVLAYFEEKKAAATFEELAQLVRQHFPVMAWSKATWHWYRVEIRKGRYDHRLSKEAIAAVKAPKAPRFSNQTPPLRLSEVEQHLAHCLSKTVYFVSPRIADEIARLNREWAPEFTGAYAKHVECASYFYAGSACGFPGVRRRANKSERLTKAQKYSASACAILDLNWFPREVWSYVCTGTSYTGGRWRDSGLGKFELAHVLPHKKTQFEQDARFFTAVPAAAPHGLFTCAANVALIPKGMAKPTDSGSAFRAVFLRRYFQLYQESFSGGFTGFGLPPEIDWYHELEWNDPVEPPDWKERVAAFHEFRQRRLTRLFAGEEIPEDSDESDENEEAP